MTKRNITIAAVVASVVLSVLLLEAGLGLTRILIIIVLLLAGLSAFVYRLESMLSHKERLKRTILFLITSLVAYIVIAFVVYFGALMLFGYH